MQKMIWLLTAVSVVSGVALAGLWNQLRNERELTAALQGDRSRTQARLHEVQALARRIAACPAVPAPASIPVAASPEARPVAPAVQPVASCNVVTVPQATSDPRMEAELLKDPDYRKARLAQIRSTVPRANVGLVERLGLADQQADQLFDLLAEYQL